MATNVNSVVIEPGFRGSVSGLTHAEFSQRAIVTLTDADGRPFAATTFLGGGQNTPMAQEVNAAQPAWTFGPFKEQRTLSIAIDHIKHNASGYTPSKVIHPITVKKDADAFSPQTLIVSTVLSEDHEDDDYSDCIVTVLQYKYEGFQQ